MMAAAANIDDAVQYTWHQSVAIVPLMVIQLLFARFRSRELFSFDRLGWLLVLLVCCALAVISGKRTAVATVPLAFISAALIRREYSFVFLWGGVVAAALAFVITLHGTIFSLPLLAQRALCWLPGRWDPSLSHMEGGKDEFRERLRELAVEKIRDDPWLGRGYAVDRRLMSLIEATPNQSEKLILQMAQGSSWHNTWLGYAADFGIPASALQAFIYGFIIWLGIKTCQRLPLQSMRFTLVFYVVLYTIRDVAISHHDGHSSIGPYQRWWMYAVVIAIALHARAQAAAEAGEVAAAALRPRHPRAPRMLPPSRPRPVVGRS
jgi:O-antigen ligase